MYFLTHLNMYIHTLKGLIGLFQFFIYPILRQQYWTFLYCSPFSYRSSNFAIAKLSLLISLLQFMYEFCRLVHGFFSVLLPIQFRSSNYCDSNSCRSLRLLKALAKSNSNIFAIAFKRERATTIATAIVLRAISLKKEPSKKKQRLIPKRMQRGL